MTDTSATKVVLTCTLKALVLFNQGAVIALYFNTDLVFDLVFVIFVTLDETHINLFTINENIHMFYADFI